MQRSLTGRSSFSIGSTAANQVLGQQV